MSYEDIGPKLRMGDVIEGLVSSVTTITTPFLDSDENELSFKVTHGKYYSILSPCCQIGKESSLGKDVILITPLIELNRSFLRNPYICEDFNRINFEMSAEQSIPPDDWNNLSDNEKTQRINEGDQYAWLNYYVYEPHDLFSEYELTSKGRAPINTKFRMIDFKNLSVIKKTPISSLIDAKRLQLSIPSRNSLRDKLAEFFGTIPLEDDIATE